MSTSTKPKGDHPTKLIPDVTGRDAPSDPHAELAILATLFRYPDRYFDLSTWLLADYFHEDRNGLVYDAFGKVMAAEGLADGLTLKAQLEADGHWDRVGFDHLNKIMREGEISSDTLDRLAEIVCNKAKVRAVIAASQRIIAEGFGTLEDESVWVEDVCDRFAKLGELTTATTGATARDILMGVFAEWTGEQSSLRLGTGNPDLDRMFRKMRADQLIVVGAQSGVGKTALATGIVAHVVTQERHEDKPCGVYVQSLEMSGADLMERMIFGQARVDAYKLDEEHRAKITQEEWARITDAAKAIGVDHLYIDDRPDITPNGIRASVRRQARKMDRAGTPLRLVVVDYAQIVNGDTENKQRHDNREQEVAQVGRSMKKLAKELKIPVILLAQLNEDSVKDGRKPRASDLRESKSLKSDADKVVLIFNPSAQARSQAYRNGDRVDQSPREHVDLIVDKNRKASTGTVAATFYPGYTLFVPFEGDATDMAALREAGTQKKPRGSK